MTDTSSASAPGEEQLRAYAFRAWSQYQGFLVSMTVHAGIALGLYEAMAGRGLMDAAELGSRTGLDQRWVEEWLRVQGAVGLVTHRGDELFELPPEGAVVLADRDSLFYAGSPFASLPLRAARIDDIKDALRTGVGHSYDHYGPEGAAAVETMFRNWYRHMLTSVMIAGLDGVADKLRNGGRAADLGCGAGVALIELAKAYPEADLHGYELSPHALDRARANAEAAGVTVSWHQVTDEPLPSDASFDLIMTLDCIHDMTHPVPVIAAIATALAPDGTWLWAEPKSHPTYAQNVEQNPMAGLMYATSMTSCLASATAAPDGAGYGTLGIHEAEARRLAAEAGFSHFSTHDFGSPVNTFFEVRR